MMTIALGARRLTRRIRSEAGFSLTEMMVVIGILGVLCSMAVFQISQSRPALKGDGGMRLVLAQMNTARELAITQRRYMRVGFTSPNIVQIVREDTTTTTTVISSIVMEGGVQFLLSTGVPDTPDAFGKSSAVAFGSATQMKFGPDGTFVDQAGGSLNGTVFLALPNAVQSARAVTVLGSTGRIRAYKWNGSQWRVA